jgi:hypothetical protein
LERERAMGQGSGIREQGFGAGTETVGDEMDDETSKSLMLADR